MQNNNTLDLPIVSVFYSRKSISYLYLILGILFVGSAWFLFYCNIPFFFGLLIILPIILLGIWIICVQITIIRENLQDNYALKLDDEGFIAPRFFKNKTVKILWKDVYYVHKTQNHTSLEIIDKDEYLKPMRFCYKILVHGSDEYNDKFTGIGFSTIMLKTDIETLSASIYHFYGQYKEKDEKLAEQERVIAELLKKLNL
jgi:hypothetical protein